MSVMVAVVQLQDVRTGSISVLYFQGCSLPRRELGSGFGDRRKPRWPERSPCTTLHRMHVDVRIGGGVHPSGIQIPVFKEVIKQGERPVRAVAVTFASGMQPQESQKSVRSFRDCLIGE